MFVPFDVMKREHRAVTGWQLGNRLVQRDPVDHGHRVGVFRTFYDLDGRFAIFSRLLHTHSAFAEVHQHLIDCEPVEPGCKSGFSPKTADFSKELYEDLLCEVFSLRDVAGHTQAEGVDAAIMALV